MRFVILMLSLFIASPAAADWVTTQRTDHASTSYANQRYRVALECNRGGNLLLTIYDESLQGDKMDGIRGVMVWITLPDGRTDRWPVDIVQEGPSVAGDVIVSETNLDFFRNGKSFRIDAPETGTVFIEGSMKGTGAARLAFLEQCGI